MRIKHLQKGFTLIEALVAILILAAVITGSLVAITNGLRSAYRAKNQITAFYLIQDGFEHIKHLRDHKKNKGETWEQFKQIFRSSCASSNSKCQVDTTVSDGASGIASCTDCTLWYEDTNYTYNNANTSKTPFKRYFYVQEKTNNGVSNELEITITVEWTEIIGSKSVTMTKSLYETTL